ncbi:hypothetical protein AMTRI_Chr01g102660 [Amborella trichopoda]
MGKKVKKVMKNVGNDLPAASSIPENQSLDFLPLEGGPGKRIPNEEDVNVSNSTVLYIGRIPRGFYEDEMRGFFEQFGTIKNLRIARNRKTGKSKHYGYIEFQSPEVAKIVADCMHNYLLYEHMLQVHLVPPERILPKLWKGANSKFRPVNLQAIELKRHNKERTTGEHKRLVQRIQRRERKRQRKIKAAGIDYECPDILFSVQPGPYTPFI